MRVCGEEIVCQAVGGRMEDAVDENCKERECLPEGDEALVCFWREEFGRGESHEDGGEQVAECY